MLVLEPTDSTIYYLLENTNSQHLDKTSSCNYSANQWEPECLDFPQPNTTKTASDITVPSETQNKPVREEHLFREGNGSRSLRLEKKMKVLEMMNGGDADYALDVEEALRYYARLNCPVYVDIVDKFFMDMYRDYYLPQLSISQPSVNQRLGSSLRLGPVFL